jgi:hypothetical protein
MHQGSSLFVLTVAMKFVVLCKPLTLRRRWLAKVTFPRLKTPYATELSYASTVNTERGKSLVVGIEGCEMRPQAFQF